jgi:hypothetical protein
MELMFDWMGYKHRLNPVRELGGKDEEFRMLRAGDNQFYWLSLGVNPNRLAEPDAAKIAATLAARACASIFEKNVIHVNTAGVHQVTLLLGPKMLTFTEPVSVRINGSAAVKRTVTPDLETLQEHLVRTGDRQRVVVARLEFKI